MPHLERENGSLYYEVHECPLPWVQRPATILFCHGVATNADIWAGWLPTLSAHYRVVRFDTRGFGRSAVPGAGFPWSMDLLVDDVLAIAGASGTKKFHLVGESLGGTVALATAISGETGFNASDDGNGVVTLTGERRVTLSTNSQGVVQHGKTLFVNKTADAAGLQRAVECSALSVSWRGYFEKRLEKHLAGGERGQ